jgi:Protein of unknown function (DUF2950)
MFVEMTHERIGNMKLHSMKWNSYLETVLLMVALVCVLGCNQKAPVATEAAAQSTFATPEEAGQALQAATKADDENGLTQILGRSSKELLSSGDPAEDREARQSFVTKYDRMNRWASMAAGSRVLYIGADNYPFPIPLAQEPSSKWYFNTAAGEEEILARRIGRNELLAIDASTAIANAEELYRQKAHSYTQKILSSPGIEDGLHWEVPKNAEPSPLGRLGEFAKAATASATPDGSPVFDGYSFRILTAQGEGVEGGAKSYLVNGRLAGGFAVIATPVKYQDSGIMTFIISREGVVYQKDLGKATASIAATIQDYNPADGWKPAE